MLMPRLRKSGYASATSCELVLSTRTVLEPDVPRKSTSLGSASGACWEEASADETVPMGMETWSVL
jgi:hypothetical protein